VFEFYDANGVQWRGGLGTDLRYHLRLRSAAYGYAAGAEVPGLSFASSPGAAESAGKAKVAAYLAKLDLTSAQDRTSANQGLVILVILALLVAGSK